jgi:hypothetical protein
VPLEVAFDALGLLALARVARHRSIGSEGAEAVDELVADRLQLGRGE